MSKEERRKSKLVGPWRTLHTVVWLLGIVILAVNNWWWPGILVLVVISMIIEAVLRQVKPDAFEATQAESPTIPVPAAPAAPTAAPAPADPAAAPAPAASVLSPEYPAELLPTNCPKCGGPIRGHEVKWTGQRSADCPFCGANLPLVKS